MAVMRKKVKGFYNDEGFDPAWWRRRLKSNRKIIVQLPSAMLGMLLLLMYDRTFSMINAIELQRDRLLGKKAGSAVKMHGLLRWKLFQLSLVLDEILRLDFFQELYRQEWDFQEEMKRTYTGREQKEGSKKDYYNRFLMIVSLLHVLTAREGIIPYPAMVKRFCKKVRKLHSEEYWKNEGMTWKAAGAYLRKGPEKEAGKDDNKRGGAKRRRG